MKRPGATLAGMAGLALAAVVVLCGAGSAPLENFAPQGTMQNDLNAGGHNLTNAATISATNLIVDGTNITGGGGLTLGNNATNAAPGAGSASYAAASGSTNYDAAGVAAAAQSAAQSYASNAGNISTGTLTVAHGGTGLASLTSGYLILGNGTSTPTLIPISASAQTAIGNAANGPGGLMTQAPPAGSVLIILGDSIAAGYPIVTLASGNTIQSGYTGPGKPWAQQLSATAAFHGVAVYDYGVGGALSSAGAGVLSGSANHGTEYLNGAVVGSYGGISAAPSTYLATGTGTTYWVTGYGTNDLTSGSLSSFETNMAALWNTIHGYAGTNRIIGTTITDREDNANGWSAISFYPFDTWIRAQLGAGASGVDLLADVAATLNNAADQNYFQPDFLHLRAAGNTYYGQTVLNALMNGAPAAPISSPAPLSVSSLFVNVTGYGMGSGSSSPTKIVLDDSFAAPGLAEGGNTAMKLDLLHNSVANNDAGIGFSPTGRMDFTALSGSGFAFYSNAATPVFLGSLDGTGLTVAVLKETTSATPATSSASGSTGQILWDGNYLYVCVATNTWKRSALSTW